MRKYGIPVLAVAAGIGIGLLIATSRTPATAEAAREFSIAAVPGEKGGSDVFGPYEVVADWPKPMSASLPGHENWTWGSAEGIFAESPDRVFGFQRGELPLMEEPEPRPVPGFGHGISFPMNFGGGVPSYVRNASGASPGGGNYRGKMGVDARWEHNIVVFDREGNIIEAEVWSKWDSMFRRPHAVHINPYDAEKHIWFVDDAAHAVYKFSNDGRTLVQTLGTPYERGDDGKHFNRPTYLAWLPDSTLFVADGYANTRVAKFDARGNYLMSWGQRGSQEESHGSPPDTRPGYFNTVHGVVVDPETRRVFVNDRNNRRVQVFDENGTFLDQWSFGKAGSADAHSIYMDDDRDLWVMDRTASKMVKYDREGHFLYSWGVAGMFPGGFFGPHQTAVDQEGNFYTAEVNGGRFQKYRPRRGANPAFMIAPIRARR